LAGSVCRMRLAKSGSIELWACGVALREPAEFVLSAVAAP